MNFWNSKFYKKMFLVGNANFNMVFPVVVLVFYFEEFSEEVLHGHWNHHLVWTLPWPISLKENVPSYPDRYAVKEMMVNI
jgi:hypothetical protein